MQFASPSPETVTWPECLLCSAPSHANEGVALTLFLFSFFPFFSSVTSPNSLSGPADPRRALLLVTVPGPQCLFPLWLSLRVLKGNSGPGLTWRDLAADPRPPRPARRSRMRGGRERRLPGREWEWERGRKVTRKWQRCTTPVAARARQA